MKVFIEFGVCFIGSLESILIGLIELRLLYEQFLYVNELFFDFLFLDFFLIVDNDFEQRRVLFWEILVSFLIKFYWEVSLMWKLRLWKHWLMIGIEIDERTSGLLADIFHKVDFELIKTLFAWNNHKRLAIDIILFVGLNSVIVHMKCGFREEQ